MSSRDWDGGADALVGDTNRFPQSRATVPGQWLTMAYAYNVTEVITVAACLYFILILSLGLSLTSLPQNPYFFFNGTVSVLGDTVNLSVGSYWGLTIFFMFNGFFQVIQADVSFGTFISLYTVPGKIEDMYAPRKGKKPWIWRVFCVAVTSRLLQLGFLLIQLVGLSSNMLFFIFSGLGMAIAICAGNCLTIIKGQRLIPTTPLKSSNSNG